MKNILSLLCAILIMILISATTTSLMTIKPALPKYVITDTFYSSKNASNYIKENTHKGFILHAISSQNSYSIVIMHKY